MVGPGLSPALPFCLLFLLEANDVDSVESIHQSLVANVISEDTAFVFDDIQDGECPLFSFDLNYFAFFNHSFSIPGSVRYVKRAYVDFVVVDVMQVR